MQDKFKLNAVIGDLENWVSSRSLMIMRIVLFLTFFGHGLVSLGFSPTYVFHYKLIFYLNFTGFPEEILIKIQALFDLIMSFLILFGIRLRIVLPIAIFYLISVGFAAWWAYYISYSKPTGIAEYFRRFPWIFYSLFLYLAVNGRKEYHLIRIGLSFAFLSHGMASLGLGGFNKAHIDLAGQFFSREIAQKIVFYSGFSDITIGLLLLTGIFSRPIILLGIIWITLVDFASFIRALPDGIFRMGFLLSAIYVLLDKRCHEINLISFIRRKLSQNLSNSLKILNSR